MQPDYFAMLRTLYEYKIAKQIGAKANSLLMALIWKANVMRFPNSLAIWNSEVRDLAGLSDEELAAARNSITRVQVNGQYIVRYQTGGTKAPGKYQLNYQGLCTFFQDMSPAITPKNAVNVQGNPQGNEGGNPQGNDEGNEGGISILTKQNEQNIQTNPPPPPKQVKVFEPESIEYKLSSYLLEKIKLHLPSVKEPDLQKWAGDMDLLIRVDKRTPQEVKDVIEFAQSDSFWKSVILSVGNLRKKYDQLNAKRNTGKTTPAKREEETQNGYPNEW